MLCPCGGLLPYHDDVCRDDMISAPRAFHFRIKSVDSGEVPPPSASGLQPYATGLTCHYAAKLRSDSFRDFDHTGKTSASERFCGGQQTLCCKSNSLTDQSNFKPVPLCG